MLTKTPVVAGLFTLAAAASDFSLYAARGVSIVASLLTTLPVFFIARRLAGRASGSLAAVLWLLGSGPVIFHSLGQTEAVAAFFASSAVALWLVASDARSIRRAAGLAMLGGLAVAAAFAARKVSIAALVPMAVWLLVQPLPSRRVWLLLGAVAGGVSVLLLPLGVFAGWLYGDVGVHQLFGAGYGSIITSRLQAPNVVTSWGAHAAWVGSTVARTSGPYLLLAGVGIVLAGWRLLTGGRAQPDAWRAAVPLAWLLVIVLLYASWPTLLPEYLSDAYAAVVLLAAVGLGALRQSRSVVTAMVLGLFLFCSAASLVSVYQRPWLGMFTPAAVREAAALLHEHVPPSEPVFTAATIVPYYSGHRTVLDIAHPHWYQYGFIDGATLAAFLPAQRELDAAFDSAEWALVEHLTDYAYLRGERNLIERLPAEWQLVAEVANDTGFRRNTLYLWQRR